MKVRVLFFAGLRDRIGQSEFELDGLESGATLEHVRSVLEERWPFLQEYPLAVAHNCQVVSADVSLEEGDEIALLPPVSGG